ncbi:hypothetical protein L9F63_011005, partial [Diploptera punctata]
MFSPLLPLEDPDISSRSRYFFEYIHRESGKFEWEIFGEICGTNGGSRFVKVNPSEDSDIYEVVPSGVGENFMGQIFYSSPIGDFSISSLGCCDKLCGMFSPVLSLEDP